MTWWVGGRSKKQSAPDDIAGLKKLAAGHFGGKNWGNWDEDGPFRNIMFHNDAQLSRKHFQMDTQRHYVQCVEICCNFISKWKIVILTPICLLINFQTGSNGCHSIALWTVYDIPFHCVKVGPSVRFQIGENIGNQSHFAASWTFLGSNCKSAVNRIKSDPKDFDFMKNKNNQNIVC